MKYLMRLTGWEHFDAYAKAHHFYAETFIQATAVDDSRVREVIRLDNLFQ